MKGRVIPFVGMIDNELKILINDCKPNEHVKPTIAIISNGSFIIKSFNKKRTIIVKINIIIIEQKIKPSSSPATANC